MPGYHNDQFYNLGSPNSGEDTKFGVTNRYGRGGWAVVGADNPPFVYPDSSVRTVDSTGNRTQLLKRGYIRSIVDSIDGQNIAIRKCQFQFNPATIQQTVMANTSILNVFQQDPAQFAQPTPGNVNFGFQLMFDRSMEINNLLPTDQGVVDSVNPWRQNDPSQVGVFRDLGAFFGVIGQGLSDEIGAFAQQYVEDQIKAEISAKSVADALSLPQQTAEYAKAAASIPEFMEVNIANSSFLLPLPVRVVFSSLYIVEGLVTNTDLVLTKFSTTMVPMQCIVNVTMEAKYIGFAKKKTFFTWSLEKRKELELQEAAAERAASVANYNALTTAVSKATVMVEDFSYSGGVPFLSDRDSYGKIKVSIPNANGTTDEVAKLYDTSSTPSVKTTASVTIYRSPASLAKFTGTNYEQYARSFCSVEYFGQLSEGDSTVPVAATKADWKKLVAGAYSSPIVVRNSYDGGPNFYDETTAWFIVNYKVKVSAKIGPDTFVGSGEAWVLNGPGINWTPRHAVPLVWPYTGPPAPASSGDHVGTTPTAPRQGRGSGDPGPGKVSPVGTPPKNAPPIIPARGAY